MSRGRELPPVLFLWVPKAAGTSIWAAIEAAYGPAAQKVVLEKGQRLDPAKRAITFRHASLASLVQRQALRPEDVRRRWRFAFVRNPWDRLVSLWCYLRGHQTRDRQELMRGPAATFLAFVELVAAGPIDPTGPYASRGISQANPQTAWLREPIDDGEAWLPDFIGRFERLEEDWEVVCDRLGIGAHLPHLNTTDHGHYRTYYDPRTRDLVARKYAEEIALFGYDF